MPFRVTIVPFRVTRRYVTLDVRYSGMSACQVAKHGKKWTLIGKELERTADACRDKFRELIPGDNLQEGGKECRK